MKGSVLARALGVAFVLALGGCGDDGPAPAPKDVAGPAQGVADLVEKLERAVRARDFQTLCERLLTPAARERAGGRRCAATMTEASKGLRGPRIRVLSINIAGKRAAQARLRSRAVGQRPVEETLRLERRGGRYRIASLSG